MGVKMAEVSRSLVAATSSSRFVVPNYWADPNSGVAYQIQVQVPQTNMNSIEAGAKTSRSAYRDGKASLAPQHREGERRHDRGPIRALQHAADGHGDREHSRDADLGTVAKQVAQADARTRRSPAESKRRGARPGRADAADAGWLANRTAARGRGDFSVAGGEFSIASNSAFIVVSTIPAVIAGVVLALWLTGTTLNIQSFMGAIMAVGVAVANAILLVTFAERSRLTGANATDAAVEGAQSRLRPILMTSVAMIAGMMPMALAWRRRRTNRAAGARRGWRPHRRDVGHVACFAVCVRHFARALQYQIAIARSRG